MPRIPIMLGSALAAIVVLSLVIDVEAQGPGRRNQNQGGGNQGGPGGPGGGGGGGGRGGPGGPGGFGGGPGGFGGPGGGGPGGGTFGLVSNKAVQDELKLTDKQKDQIKKASEASDKMRQALMAKMPNRRGGGNQNQNQNQAQQPEVDEEGNVIAPPSREEIQEAFQSLQEESEGALNKVLNKVQKTRLAEIDLQRAGPSGLFRPEVIERVGIDDEQQSQMQEIMNQSRQSSREMWQASRESMPQPVRGEDGNIDREAMKAQMEKPEVKKQMEDMRKAGEKIQDQTMVELGKVLYKPQKNTFNKMLGKPFDLAKLNNGGPGGRDRNQTPADAKAKDAKTDTSKETASSTPKKSTRKNATTKKKASAVS